MRHGLMVCSTGSNSGIFKQCARHPKLSRNSMLHTVSSEQMLSSQVIEKSFSSRPANRRARSASNMRSCLGSPSHTIRLYASILASVCSLLGHVKTGIRSTSFPFHPQAS